MKVHSIKQCHIYPYKNRDNFNFQVKRLPYSADEKEVLENVPTTVERKLGAYIRLYDKSKNKFAQWM
jgi:hypothetical protein